MKAFTFCAVVAAFGLAAVVIGPLSAALHFAGGCVLGLVGSCAVRWAWHGFRCARAVSLLCKVQGVSAEDFLRSASRVTADEVRGHVDYQKCLARRIEEDRDQLRREATTSGRIIYDQRAQLNKALNLTVALHSATVDARRMVKHGSPEWRLNEHIHDRINRLLEVLRA